MGNFYRGFIAATAITVLLFGAVQLIQQGQATVPEETEPIIQTAPEAPRETVPPTEPPSPAELACEDVGSKVSAGHIFVYDVTDRKMLYSSAPSTESFYPASITKLFSAWVALQILKPETVVTAGWELGLLQSGSSTALIGLGSRLTVEMLVEAMLLPSGNDAAYILSAAAGRELTGDPNLSAKEAVAAFIEEMNRMAQVVGLANSHFENPDGYHAENHYSCAGDLATIGELALGNAVIAKYAATQQDSVRFVSGETIAWYNNNRLLNPESAWYCEKAIGLKTGYTEDAGYCLLAAFEEHDRQILVGIFDAENTLSRYSDAIRLFHAAVDN